MMNKKGGLISMLILVIILLIVGFYWFVNSPQVQKNVNIELTRESELKQETASPASITCLSNNFTLEVRIDSKTNERINVCIDKFGKECEEWKYYNKECELAK